ncbi:MAG: isocitrate lyase/PEP mutase family protein [Methyloligellaceae bacterium]
MKKKTTVLRELLAEGKSIYVPGVYNALSARILDQVGFPALYMTGYGTSVSLLGMPDAGLATMSEMHMNARYIANAVKVPVIADSDNGYGNAVNVVRTVKEYIQTGVAAIHIEDQVIPKRCGHVAGRRVISIEEACGKYRAADHARKEVDPDFVLVARTDARGAHGGSLDDAIKRANAYLASGADLAFVEGPTSVDEVKRICAEVKGPIFYNQTGISPHFTQKELEELGIAITISPGATFRATMVAMYDLAIAMKEDGPTGVTKFNERFIDHPMGDFHTFAGFDEIMELEKKFMPEEELEKYDDSVGHRPKAAE